MQMNTTPFYRIPKLRNCSLCICKLNSIRSWSWI